MDKTKIRTLRLKKQQISLDKQPIEQAFVKRQGDLKFYFCLYNLQDDYKNGFYFGLLQLHPQYPFAAPKLYMYTPNGRYQLNMAICTSFTNYHPQTWTSAWNVRTLIQATISFMYANEPSYGCLNQTSSDLRKNLAKQSLSWNMQNELFVKLFGQTIIQKLPHIVKLGIKIYDDKVKLKLIQSGIVYKDQKLIKKIQQIQQNRRQINQIDQNFQRPLIINQYIQIDQNNIFQNRQDQLNIKNIERNNKNNNKAKKIIKIIGYCGAALIVGIVGYAVYVKIGAQSS